jgi:hypothetical protein
MSDQDDDVDSGFLAYLSALKSESWQLYGSLAVSVGSGAWALLQARAAEPKGLSPWLTGLVQAVSPLVFVFAATFLLAWASFATWRTERQQRVAAEARHRNRTPLLTFTASDSACYQLDPGRYQLVRVGITSARCAANVQVRLVQIRPTPESLQGRLPLPLQPQHFASAPSNYIVPIADGETRFFDLVSVLEGIEELFIAHTVRSDMGNIPLAPYAFEVQVVGEHFQAVSREMRVWIDAQGKLRLRIVDNGHGEP